MSLGSYQFKFKTDLVTRAGIERIADFHNIGANGSSGNEVMKIVASQIGKIPGKNFFQAMAALSEFQSHAPKRKVRVSPVSVLRRDFSA